MNTIKFVVLMLCCWVTACGVTVQGIDLGRVAGVGSKVMNVGEKTQEEEVVMGERTAKTLFSIAPLAHDDKIQSYVNRVGYWLARHSTRPGLPWHFVVLDSATVNAFAAPGGYVFITTGMMENIYNEAELAGVLAHEMAHVTEKHYLHALQSQSNKGLISDLLVLGQQAKKNQEDERSNSRSSKITGQYDRVVLDVYQRGLDRKDELFADSLGAEIAARAGYDHYGFASVLQNITGSQSDVRVMAGFLKRHPPLEERLIALEKTSQTLDDMGGDSKVLVARYSLNTRTSPGHL